MQRLPASLSFDKLSQTTLDGTSEVQLWFDTYKKHSDSANSANAVALSPCGDSYRMSYLKAAAVSPLLSENMS